MSGLVAFSLPDAASDVQSPVWLKWTATDKLPKSSPTSAGYLSSSDRSTNGDVDDLWVNVPDVVYYNGRSTRARLPAANVVSACAAQQQVIHEEAIAANKSEQPSRKDTRSRPPKFIRERVRRRQERAAEQQGLDVAPAQPTTPQKARTSPADSSYREPSGRWTANRAQQSGAEDLYEHDGYAALGQEPLGIGAEIATEARLAQHLARLQTHIEQKRFLMHYQQVLIQQQPASNARQPQPLQPFPFVPGHIRSRMQAGHSDLHEGNGQVDDVFRMQAMLNKFNLQSF